MMSCHPRLLLCALFFIALAAPPSGGSLSAAPQVATSPVDRLLARRADDAIAHRRSASLAPASRARAPRLAIRLNPGDVVTATPRRSSTLRLQLASDPIKIRRYRLDIEFVPRGVDYEPEAPQVAIAAVSQVLLVDTTTGAVTVLDAPVGLAAAFGFVNDVLFLDSQTLLIADTGAQVSGRLPQDGHLWRYEIPTATFSELATHAMLSNPRELARGPAGEIYLVDGEAGQAITPIFELYFDRLYKVAGKKLLNAQTVYSGPGIEATAFDVALDGSFWFANVAELTLLRDGVLSYPCGLSLPFEFATGLAVTGDTSAYVLDGAGSPPSRALYQVDDQCATTLLSNKGKLKEARGLVQVPELSTTR